MINQEQKLQSIFGLTSHEVKIYLAALNFSRASLSELAKKAGIARTAAYPPIQSLMAKGLLSAIKLKKRTHYQASKPEELTHILERNRVDLNSIIQSLSQTLSPEGGALEVNYYSGAAGMALAGEIFLKDSPKNSLWKSFETPEHNLSLFGEALFDEHTKKRLAKNIRGKCIIPADIKSDWIKKHINDDKKELRETILVSPSIYPLEVTIGVNDNMTIIYSSKKTHFCVLIKNREVAQTIGTIHDMVWDRFKPQN